MPFYYYFVGIVMLIATMLKIYMKFTIGKFTIKKDLNGKVILITGPTAGIGKATAAELARAGATVHMACRNKSKGDKLAEEIRKATNNPNVFVHEMDLASFKSVKRFSVEFLSTNQAIHVLINNAGIVAKKQTLTEDGFDLTMQTNYFGHFLLTNLLLDRIIDSAPSRIINVSAIGHKFVKSVDLTDLNYRHLPYSLTGVYSFSKLCNILFTTELSKRLHDTGVTANSLCPGPVQTDIFDNLPLYMWPLVKILSPFHKSPLEGAQTSLYLAVSDEVENVSGFYFSDCKPKSTSLMAMDGKLAKDLWLESERSLKIHL